MKRIATWLLLIALLLGLSACGGETPPTDENTPTDTEPVTTTTAPRPTVALQDALAAVQPATHYPWAENLPRMDGSTSTIPLEAGIRAALFGTSMAEAELQVKHSTTWESFYNLIDGWCDLIFTVPLSDEQMKQAKERGVTLEMAKVAAEGFVFVVNAQNPVDSLTQQQLRDIYSGKITNWSQVGGNDAPIVAYQRNETSGSQNFMHTFMGDTPLTDPLTCAALPPNSMGSLMDAVAYYDNAQNAIGYSVYAYAADMYRSQGAVKFIHVDGVEPTKESMVDGSYPLLSYNYAVFNAAEKTGSALRMLVDWIGTDEGQRAVKAAGYVPLRPVGEMEETTVRLYSAVGTGPEKPEGHATAAYRYELKGETMDNWATYADDVINSLKNLALRQEIQEFVRSSKAEMTAVQPNEEWTTRTRVQCINGYMAVWVDAWQNGGNWYDVRTAIYDLVAAKRIAFSDLFYQGEEFVPQLNEQIAQRITEQRWDVDEAGEPWGDESPLKRAFAGIPAGHDTFTLTEVTFPENNLYFNGYPFTLAFREMGDKMALYEPRDMKDLFGSGVTVRRSFWIEDGYGVKEPLLLDNLYAEVLDEHHYDKAVCDKVNAALRTFCRETMSQQALNDWCQKAYGSDLGWEGAWIDAETFGNRYIFFEGKTLFVVNDFTVSPEYGVALLFDAETGEPVPYTVLLKDGWERTSRWMRGGNVSGSGATELHEGEMIAPPDLTDATLYQIGTWDGGVQMTFGFANRELPLVTVAIPSSYVNWEL